MAQVIVLAILVAIVYFIKEKIFGFFKMSREKESKVRLAQAIVIASEQLNGESLNLETRVELRNMSKEFHKRLYKREYKYINGLDDGVKISGVYIALLCFLEPLSEDNGLAEFPDLGISPYLALATMAIIISQINNSSDKFKPKNNKEQDIYNSTIMELKLSDSQL